MLKRLVLQCYTDTELPPNVTLNALSLMKKKHSKKLSKIFILDAET